MISIKSTSLTYGSPVVDDVVSLNHLILVPIHAISSKFALQEAVSYLADIRKGGCHAIFSKSSECGTCRVLGVTAVWLQRFGRAENGGGGSDLGMGAGSWRRGSRKGVNALFGRCRTLGHAVAGRAFRPGGAKRLFRVRL